ncbi:MAG: HupE/UreJ family protein [Deltaproteobacteria bacterium]|nr:HupE/UreJ family protein [Deltaproteobacteria bacterium]
MGSLLAFGFLLGMRHALDADHIAAVAALATRSTSLRDTLKVATAWGMGHALTLVFAVSGMILLDATLPPRLDHLFEIAVGIVSILLGVDVLRRAHRGGVHIHVHQHDEGKRHLHVHAHEPKEVDHPAAAHHHHPHIGGALSRALLVGSLHGMAGSAVLLLVWLRAIPSGAGVILYVALFAAGTILGMVLFSMVIAVPMRGAAQLPRWAARGLDVAVGTAALIVGVLIVSRAIT